MDASIPLFLVWHCHISGITQLDTDKESVHTILLNNSDFTIDASGSLEKSGKLWQGQRGGGGLLPPLDKTFGQIHYKIVPFPDTWDKLFEI